MANQLEFLKDKIADLKEQGLYHDLKVLSSPQGARSVINGKEVVNLSSNNYLGLANNPKLKEATIAATEKYGAGAGAVRTIIGNMSIHEELEKKLAKFKGVEAVTVYQSGFTANMGTIAALVDAGDVIISDELNHASIIDGCRLSKADVKRFKHSDMRDLERVLKDCSAYDHKLIITDGVFSMDGDIAKLPEIVELAEKYGAMTYVDDAHASGVLGRSGRGSVDHFNLHGRVDVQIGTLSKAIGVVGGYVAGRQELKDYLIQRGRPLLFSTAMTPGATAACIAAIDILSTDTSYTDRLWDNTRYFKAALKDMGFDTGHSETPITPVLVGDSKLANTLSDSLFEEGVFAQSIVYPTVPMGKARVRTIVTAGHTKDDLDFALKVFGKVGKKLNII